MDWVLLDIPPSGRDPATTWIAISVGILAVVYVTLVKPLRTKKKKDPLEAGPARTSLSQQRGVEREMSNLLVELSGMARQMTAQLDTRSAKLELLLRDADERIATLRSLGAGAGLATSSSADSAAAEALEGVIVEARASSSHSIPEQKLDPRHAKVYGLADEGHTPQEIARQLERPSGEIELILALRSDDAR
jgi:hypothetical protein